MFSLHLSSPLSKLSFPHVPKQTLPRTQLHVRPSLSAIISNPKKAALSTETRNAVVNRSAEEAEPENECLLPEGLKRELMPNHVAVIADGNRRWAQMRGLPSGLGYVEGFRALIRVVELCCQMEIKVLTVFAFSRENWVRPRVEVDLLLGLFERRLKEDLDKFVREDIRISMIGDSSKLPKVLIDLMTNAEKTTVNNSRLHFVVAINYSGQNDVVQACRRISQRVKDGLVEPNDVDESMVEQELETSCTDFPCPDLLIRTSGELRVSNFLLWQLAYTELFFTQSHWPDFGETDFFQALSSFQQRQRRYGGS